jgi:hypothetical protein
MFCTLIQHLKRTEKKLMFNGFEYAKYYQILTELSFDENLPSNYCRIFLSTFQK